MSEIKKDGQNDRESSLRLRGNEPNRIKWQLQPLSGTMLPEAEIKQGLKNLETEPSAVLELKKKMSKRKRSTIIRKGGKKKC